MSEPKNYHYGDAVQNLRAMEEEKQFQDAKKLLSLNINETTDSPQIHISGMDGPDVEEATQLVFHKQADGTLFVEWFTKDEHAKKGMTSYLMVNIDSVGKQKLIDFFTNPITYK